MDDDGGTVQVKEVAAVSDRGARHSVNEDAVLWADEAMMCAVADGLGGPGAGDHASQAAVRSLEHGVEKLLRVARRVVEDSSSAGRLRVAGALERAVLNAHEAVERTCCGDAQGAATTLVAALITPTHAHIAHVGDSRAYLIRRGRIRTLTEDHTLAMLRYRQGRMSLEEYRSSPLQQKLYQVLGAGSDVDVDLAEVELANNDVLFLCSDGVHKHLTARSIVQAVHKRPVESAAIELLNEARRNGSDDDASLVLLRIRAEERSKQLDNIAAILSEVFLFRGLSEAERQMVAPYLDKKLLPAGEVLFHRGDPGDAFFVVVEGSVSITRNNSHLVDIHAGGHFGELCLSRPVPRSATVTAREPTIVFKLHRERFQEIVRRRPTVGARIAIACLDHLGDRIRDLTDRVDRLERRVPSE